MHENSLTKKLNILQCFSVVRAKCGMNEHAARKLSTITPYIHPVMTQSQAGYITEAEKKTLTPSASQLFYPTNIHTRHIHCMQATKMAALSDHHSFDANARPWDSKSEGAAGRASTIFLMAALSSARGKIRMFLTVLISVLNCKLHMASAQCAVHQMCSTQRSVPGRDAADRSPGSPFDPLSKKAPTTLPSFTQYAPNFEPGVRSPNNVTSPSLTP